MATVTAISTKGGGGGKKSLDYICRDDKTENKKFVTALNCSLPTAYQEFQNTRVMYGKTDGIRYYHFVQSHPSGYNIAPELAYKIAVEFAERAFPGHEVVVATHTDADHIHSHFVLNAVNADTGLKYNSNKFTLQDLRQLSDEICQKYGVTTLSKPEIHKQSNGITNGEYRVAMRGESWKMALSNTIDMVMKRARSKKQFRFYMKQMGYDVKWEDSRKYITYTCPNGRRCRDNKLHEAKYRKENMEYEFEIRRSERSLQAEYAGGTGHTNYGLRTGTQLAGGDITAETSDGYAVRCQGSDRRDNDICTDGTVPAKSADDIQSAAGTGEGDTGADVTKRDAQMKQYLQNQRTIYNQLLEQGKEIQEQTSQNVTAEVSKLNQTAKALESQAGSLNEQTLSQLKCSEEQSRSHGFRLLRLVVLIELLHLISSVVLLLWLR